LSNRREIDQFVD